MGIFRWCWARVSGRDRPIGATAAVGEYVPEDAVVSVTGLAIVPDEAANSWYQHPDEVERNPLRL